MSRPPLSRYVAVDESLRGTSELHNPFSDAAKRSSELASKPCESFSELITSPVNGGLAQLQNELRGQASR